MADKISTRNNKHRIHCKLPSSLVFCLFVSRKAPSHRFPTCRFQSPRRLQLTVQHDRCKAQTKWSTPKGRAQALWTGLKKSQCSSKGPAHTTASSTFLLNFSFSVSFSPLSFSASLGRGGEGGGRKGKESSLAVLLLFHFFHSWLEQTERSWWAALYVVYPS